MDRVAIINFLKQNKKRLESEYKIKKIGLFGSYSRGNARENSDIDILVDMPSSFDNYFALKEFLETNLQKNIDLGLENSIREHLKERIYREVEYV